MGNLKHEGRAVDVVAPAGKEIVKGELYRVNKWNGIAMAHVLPTDPELGFAMEVSERVWYITVPSGLGGTRGDVLYWVSGEGFKYGATDLVASGTTNAIGPAAKVEEVTDANFICGVRVLNVS